MRTEPASQGLLHTARCSTVSNTVARISAGMDGADLSVFSAPCSACAATRPAFRRSAGWVRAAMKGVHVAGSASRSESSSRSSRTPRARAAGGSAIRAPGRTGG
eukprot:scaffold85562_cov69-Phaeocystis_antarctica.AAC.1